MSFVTGIINLFRFDKTNWRAVALCLAAATVFWFFNALNKEHTATISFPVDFKYNETTFVPIRELPQNVLINITGIGWDLLRKSIGFKVDPLFISLDRPAEIKKLPPGSLLALATAQFDQLKINHIASDTLMISIDRRKVKNVKLFVAKDQLTFKPNYGRSSEISIAPDSISLSGPASILDQIPDSIQLRIQKDALDEDVDTDGEIILPTITDIGKSSETARIKFHVSGLAEITKKIKIVVFPAPPFRHYLSTDSALVRYRVPESLRDSLVVASHLFAVIDLREYDAGIIKTIPTVKGTVPFAKIVSIDSITLRKY